MSPLASKRILIGVSGGISAYKVIELVRRLVRARAEVRLILTPSASDFVSPLVLSTLSRNPVLRDFCDDAGNWNNHVELALWADLMLVAPCTANTLARMAGGVCDNLLLAVYFSAKCPVFVAPAMDLDMFAHPSTKRNLDCLSSYGCQIIPPEVGELASGLVGVGRLAEPENIYQKIEGHFGESITSKLKGKKILITAGPTHEAIDPVRFLGNHSSGKTGFSLAKSASERGAEVILIAGPCALDLTFSPKVQQHRVVSAREMLDKVFEFYDDVDIAIMSAAVADYAPKSPSKEKIKKNEESLSLELVKNPDILRMMGDRKTKQFLVGFALETENEQENALKKLKTKNLDIVVLNSLRDQGAGFGELSNKISIISRNSDVTRFDLKSKDLVSNDILDFVEKSI